MTLYFLDGHVVADDIIEGSPADRAGVKAGDVVVSINNNFSNNVETYKNLLQKVGDRASLLIMRNNVPMQLSLRVGRIR
jgi:C-terminal processing protease CtpA/Prc